MKKFLLLCCWLLAAPLRAEAPKSAYEFPPLPYGYEALEPAIDRRTMEIHYDRHFRGYFDNFVKAMAEQPDNGQPLEQLLARAGSLGPAIRNNGGGFYNHRLYWQSMSPTASEPSAELKQALESQFGSLEKFQEAFTDAGLKRFGSGWVWLIVQADGSLAITSTPNQDNPLMDVAEVKGTPILACDLWEHAYYLQYQNKRGDYLKNWWPLINWAEVSQRYAAAKKP